MRPSSAQLALDDYLWSELPAPRRSPDPLPKRVKPTCRLQRRLIYRHRVMTTAPTPKPARLRLLSPVR